MVSERPVELPQALLDRQPPTHLEGDSVKTYTGSCQCGAVAFSIKTPPLSQVEIKEDNCSICVRRAAVSIYPDRDQVLLVGEDSTTAYAFGRRFNQDHFCATCGVACYKIPVGPPPEVVERFPEDKKAFVEKMRRIRQLSVRTMNGVEWDEITIDKTDEGTEGYVVPDE